MFDPKLEEKKLKAAIKENGFYRLCSFSPDTTRGRFCIAYLKRGGYGTMIDKLREGLHLAGWLDFDSATGGRPDGSTVSHRGDVVSPDGKVLFTSGKHFGVTSRENWFTAKFMFNTDIAIDG